MRKFNYEAEPAQIMRAVVNAHGRQIFLNFSNKRLARIIANSYNKLPELRDILLKMAEFGIPAELLKFHSNDNRDQQVRVIVRRFAEKHKMPPDSKEISDAVSCFTFALDYGMFSYSVYPPVSQKDMSEPPAVPKIIPTEYIISQSYTELKDTETVTETETEAETETEVKTEAETTEPQAESVAGAEQDKGIFTDFKTWFEKKRIDEDKLKDRDNDGIYIKGEDNDYYALTQTGHLSETGTNFHILFGNFEPKKKEREIIKMGIDICSEIAEPKEPEAGEIPVVPPNIFRDRYGNYGLELDADSAAKSRSSSAERESFPIAAHPSVGTRTRRQADPDRVHSSRSQERSFTATCVPAGARRDAASSSQAWVSVSVSDRRAA